MAVNGIAQHPLTSHIIYHEEDNNGISISKMVDLRTGHHGLIIQPLSVIMRVCSSAKGMLLLHPPSFTGQVGIYYLFNPFASNMLKALPLDLLRPHCSQDPSYSVVTSDGSTFDAVVLKEYQRNEGAHYEAIVYSVYSSDTDSRTVIDIGILSGNCRALPNSGVSCGRTVFFLTSTNSVLTINVANRKRYHFSMPTIDVSAGDIIAAQLGRKRDMLGIVIANESKLWIRVYYHVQTGDKHYWIYRCSVNVELDPNCDDVSIIQGGEEGPVGRIRCKEMPRPVRFESFRLQVPLWVDGRIVMVEDSVNGKVLLRRIECQIPPSCATSGMTYVTFVRN